jgi:hypothetical protein
LIMGLVALSSIAGSLAYLFLFSLPHSAWIPNWTDWKVSLTVILLSVRKTFVIFLYKQTMQLSCILAGIID